MEFKMDSKHRFGADDSAFGDFDMIDVSLKAETLRFARAVGEIFLTQSSFDAIEKSTNPKGNVLAMAEVAGMMAAKKTSEILPLCHPLAIQKVQIRFELDSDKRSVRALCSVNVIGRTGAEMEALMGVQGALLCIYDMSKVFEPTLEMGNIRLVEKKGGKSGHWVNPKDVAWVGQSKSKKGSIPFVEMKAGVLILSDRASQGVYQDLSGPKVAEILHGFGVKELESKIIPDDAIEIKKALNHFKELGCDFVVCTGGTGLSKRDVTPETLESLCDRMIPGFGELMRSRSSIHTPLSYLSRSGAGLFGQMLMVCLSGSPKAIEETLPILKDLLPTAVMVIRGENPHEKQ